ncbi:25S rRNA (adenine(2142)-N(1))-methyltransferase [Nakaseomyces glabratus]|uniref:25S rRNA (Adenine(2142)-N(1))-methyltransferase n=1 Tax=Candida glabrata TaxID=5478 RepID=A0A0W0CE31_CANGB|nr:25S rRNA (adenine(2142)-N(1))-methyltransferase [Nakaseomyces glabratus]
MLSRKRVSISGKKPLKEVRIKPSKARRIIRRFHFLTSKRALICELLELERLRDNDEEYNSRVIDAYLGGKLLRKRYDEGQAVAAQDGMMESRLLQIRSHSDKPAKEELLRCLGYIQREIRDGGLKNYQMASKIGQDKDRGGDSSKLLVKWLKELNYDQHTELLLNFVNTPAERGQMCQRFSEFLFPPTSDVPSYVFVVLPLPCVNNSRYMTIDHFTMIMDSLGYELIRSHTSHKLFYCLLRLSHRESKRKFQKKEINPGPGRNNFAIVI